MKKLSIVSLISASIIFCACNGGSTKSTTSDTTTTTTSDTSSKMMSADTSHHMASTSNTDTSKMVMADKDTKDFAQKAATGGMMEVQLGNIAQKNSSTQAVKDFGQMMVDDHTKINDQLKSLASKKMIDLPSMVTNDQQKDIDKLSKKTGADFDKDYVSMMIDDHKKDIAEFKKNGNKLADADMKTFIMNALPTLQKHLDSIQAIKKRM